MENKTLGDNDYKLSLEMLRKFTAITIQNLSFLNTV